MKISGLPAQNGLTAGVLVELEDESGASERATLGELGAFLVPPPAPVLGYGVGHVMGPGGSVGPDSVLASVDIPPSPVRRLLIITYHVLILPAALGDIYMVINGTAHIIYRLLQGNECVTMCLNGYALAANDPCNIRLEHNGGGSSTTYADGTFNKLAWTSTPYPE